MGKWVLRISLVLAGLGLLFYLFAPVFISAHMARRYVSAQSHMRLISYALGAYTSDYDDHFPLAAHWRDDIEIYMVRGFPDYLSEPKPTCGIAMNSAVCGRSGHELQNDLVVAFSSSDKRRNAVGQSEIFAKDPWTSMSLITTLDGNVWFKSSDLQWNPH